MAGWPSMVGQQQQVPNYANMPWMQPGYAMSQVNASNGAMPSWLQIDQNWGAPEQALAQNNYMVDYVDPAVHQQYSQDNAAGSANSTFAAARNTDMQTKGARQAMLAGLDAKNAAINQKLNMRSSYNNVPTDQGLAGRLYKNAQDSYNSKQTTGANRLAGIVGAAGAVAPYALDFGKGLWNGITGKQTF